MIPKKHLNIISIVFYYNYRKNENFYPIKKYISGEIPNIKKSPNKSPKETLLTNTKTTIQNIISDTSGKSHHKNSPDINDQLQRDP